MQEEPAKRFQQGIQKLENITSYIHIFKQFIETGKQEIHYKCCQKMLYEFQPANSILFKIGIFAKTQDQQK